MIINIEIDTENEHDQFLLSTLFGLAGKGIDFEAGGKGGRGGEEKKKRVPPKTPSQKHKKHIFKNKCFWCGSGCWGHSQVKDESGTYHTACAKCQESRKRRRIFEQAKAEATLLKLGKQIGQRETVAPTKKADEAKIEG